MIKRLNIGLGWIVVGMIVILFAGFLGGRWRNKNPEYGQKWDANRNQCVWTRNGEVLVDRPSPIARIALSDEARRANYLMPQKDSKAYTEWVAKYGDSADSWQLFSIAFHTKYLSELNQRVCALELIMSDPNKAYDANSANRPN